MIVIPLFSSVLWFGNPSRRACRIPDSVSTSENGRQSELIIIMIIILKYILIIIIIITYFTYFTDSKNYNYNNNYYGVYVLYGF